MRRDCDSTVEVPNYAFDDLSGGADGAVVRHPPRAPRRFIAVRVYETYAEAKPALDRFSVFVYTYETRWSASIVACNDAARIKITTLEEETSQRVYQLSEGGSHH